MSRVAGRSGAADADADASIPVWLRGPAGQPFTIEDLDAITRDGRRYELLDGALLVTPAPDARHRQVVEQLRLLLEGACPPELRVLTGVELVLGPALVLAADAVVLPRDVDAGTGRLTLVPLLVVDVATPQTTLVNETFKADAYAEAGVPSYWLLDPAVPSIRVVGGGAPDLVAVGGEPLRLTAPFEVEVVPSALAG